MATPGDAEVTEPTYIWIVRWDDFQHYAPERDRAPAWIKAYTKQHDEDEYRALSGTQRAILHDLRIAFARARGKLASEPRALTQRIGLRVTSATLETLNHAGFIEFVSRPDLDQRLELFYASRARARAHQEEVEVEEEKEPVPAPTPEANYAGSDIDWDEPNANGAGSGDLERIDPTTILEQLGHA